MSKKKVSERIYLDQFLKAQGWTLTAADVMAREPPAPDFLIRLPGARLLGVEVTEVAADHGRRNRGGSRMREDESHGTRWIRSLADAHYRGGGAPISLGVILNHTHPTRPPKPTPELHARFAPILRDAAARLAVMASDRVEVRDDRETLLATLHIHRLPESEAGYSRGWKLLNDRVGWVRNQTTEQVQARVDEKAVHLPEYRKAVADVALLLVTNGFFRSGLISFDGTVDPRGFESVFLLHYPKGEVQKLA